MQEIKMAVSDSIKINKKLKVELRHTDPEIRQFLMRFRKGSKQIRRVFETDFSAKIKVRNLARISMFFRLISCRKPEEEVCAALIQGWNTQCYPIKLREFIYKFRSNICTGIEY
jgi:hypothetical protein